MPAVSVVVPTYNRADLLERLLRALESQEPVVGGYEVVVVDDGSTDATADVVARHAAVRYYRQDNAGPAAARNRGWREARSQLVAFTDDDTVPSPRWLVDLVDAADGCDAVGGRIVPLTPGYLADFVGLERHVDHGVEADGSIRCLVTANCLWRRDWLDQLGGFDERFRGASGEDTDLTLRARSAGGRLRVLDGANVAHDHRVSVGSVLRTYFRHGHNRRQVVLANPGYGWKKRSRSLLGPAYWVRRYRYYRSHVGRLRACSYLVLRVIGLGFYVAGVVMDRCER